MHPRSAAVCWRFLTLVSSFTYEMPSLSFETDMTSLCTFHESTFCSWWALPNDNSWVWHQNTFGEERKCGGKKSQSIHHEMLQPVETVDHSTIILPSWWHCWIQTSAHPLQQAWNTKQVATADSAHYFLAGWFKASGKDQQVFYRCFSLHLFERNKGIHNKTMSI